MKLELPVVNTATRTELGSRCHRRHFLSDKLEWGKYRSPAAAFGNVIHAGAAIWWRWQTAESPFIVPGELTPNAHSAMIEGVRKEWDRNNIQSEKYSLEMAERIMGAYSEQASLAGPFSGVGAWNVVTIEERIQLEMGGYGFSFQNDRALGLLDQGRILLVDTKTTSRPDARWREQWKRSLQMKLYRKAALLTYPQMEVDILVEGIDKSSKPKVHYVITPHWSDSELDEAVDQFIRISRTDDEILRRFLLPDGSFNISDLETYALTKTAFNYGDCHSYNMECPFLPLCDAKPEDRLGILHADYEQIEQDY